MRIKIKTVLVCKEPCISLKNTSKGLHVKELLQILTSAAKSKFSTLPKIKLSLFGKIELIHLCWTHLLKHIFADSWLEVARSEFPTQNPIISLIGNLERLQNMLRRRIFQCVNMHLLRFMKLSCSDEQMFFAKNILGAPGQVCLAV